MKIAAKHLVFHLGTAKSNEKLAEKFENSSKTTSFHPFLNGWQQKISGFEKFCEMFDFFRQFSEISEKFLKFVTIREKQRKKFKNSSETASFPSTFGTWELPKVMKNQLKNLKAAAKQPVFIHF